MVGAVVAECVFGQLRAIMIQVTDCGDYFRVVYDGIETEIWAKSFDGFRTAAELKRYLETRFLE